MYTVQVVFTVHRWYTLYMILFLCLVDNEVDDLEIQIARYKPESLDNLCKTTKFTKKELQIMYRGFKQVGIIHYQSDHYNIQLKIAS